MNTPTLGKPRFASRFSHTISDERHVPEHIELGKEPGLSFELAGPREQLFFDPQKTRAAIVTCGGLCPGLNNVIRSAFFELHHGYGVSEVLGFRNGYGGLDPSTGAEPVRITPEFVDGIHRNGGTILGSSRGPQNIGEMVDTLEEMKVDILYVIG